jgi:hypothetical protein
MKMKTMRRLKHTIVPRKVRSEFDVSDATMEPAMDPPPEAVFDRVTGPYGRRHAYGFDEET